MLIERYDLEVTTPPCEPGAERFSAIARLVTENYWKSIKMVLLK